MSSLYLYSYVYECQYINMQVHGEACENQLLAFQYTVPYFLVLLCMCRSAESAEVQQMATNLEKQ